MKIGLHRGLEILVALSLSTTSTVALAHSVSQRASTYSDNQDVQVSKLGTDITWDGQSTGQISASNYVLSLDRSMSRIGDEESTESDKITDSVSLALNHTFAKLTDFRTFGSYGRDEQANTKSWGVGLSHWFWHESLRASLDLSRTVSDLEPIELLDYDSTIVELESQSTATGMTFGLRHLASTTSILDYSITHLQQHGRPDTWGAAISWRQFVAPMAGALHSSIGYTKNKGRIGTQTLYGQVDALQSELAWLQNLWQGGKSRVLYRYYRENETTRAFEDKKVFGSDSVGLSVSQDLEVNENDLTVFAGGVRYVSNTNVSGASMQMGVTATF